MKKVEGHANLFKDNHSVVNADWKSYEKAKQRKREKDRVMNLEQRMERIESLLERLLDR